MSSSISLSGSSSSHDVENQSQEEVKQPCCTWNCCCGSKMSWRDIMILPTEVLSGVGALATGSYGGVSSDIGVRNTAFTVASVFAAIFAVIVIVHICWRKDAVVADLTKTSDALEETGEELRETVDKAVAAAEKLTQENTELKEKVKELKSIPKELNKANEELKGEVEQLQAHVKELGAQLEQLNEQNTTLTGQLDRCREAIDAITEHVGKVNQANSELTTHVTDLNTNVGVLGEQNNVLKLTIGSIDKEMDQKLESLKGALSQSQSIINDSVSSFTKAILDLQAELAALQSAEKRVDLDEDDVRDRLKELEALNQQIAEKEQALKVLQEDLKAKAEALQAIEEALTKAAASLGITEEKLSGDEEGLNKFLEGFKRLDLSGLEKRLSVDSESLKKLGEKTRQQLTEIDNL